MRIGVLGTGVVGHAIAAKLVALGHDVMMGSRTANHPKASAWARDAGPRGSAGTFADAAAFGEVLFNCTRGASSLAALEAADAKNLEHKVLVDVADVLPPDDPGPESLGQRIQRAFPLTKVVKTLNTINCDVMVNPQSLAGSHTVFLSGNHADANRPSGLCSNRSGGATCWISETFLPHARPKATCPSGWPCGRRSEP